MLIKSFEPTKQRVAVYLSFNRCLVSSLLTRNRSLPEEEEKTNIDALANRDSDEQGNSMGILHSDTVNTRNLQTTVATRAETSSTGGQRTIGTNSRTQPVAKREEIKTEHSNTVAVPVARVQRSDVDRSAFELEDRKTTDVKRQRIQTGEVCDLSNVRPNIGQINRQPTSEISRQNKNNTITVPNQRNQETPPAELEDLFGEDDDFDIVDEVENLGVKQEKPVTIVDPVKEEVIDSFNDVSLSHEDYFDLNDIELGSNMAKGEGNINQIFFCTGHTKTAIMQIKEVFNIICWRVLLLVLPEHFNGS